MSNETITCQWFAMCDHEAIGTTKHPVLGDVAICERCATKFGLEVDSLPFCDDCREGRGFIDAPNHLDTGWCGDCFGGHVDDEMYDAVQDACERLDAILDAQS
jgi:hypothetical protein